MCPVLEVNRIMTEDEIPKEMLRPLGSTFPESQ